MATINTIDDLLRIVRENEEYRVALRRELLTDDLLALPSQIAEILQTQNKMLETQNSILAEQERSRQTQNRILAHIDELRETQNSMLKTQGEMLETQNVMLKTQGEMLETQNVMLKDLAETRSTQREMLKTQGEMLKTQGEILRRLDNVEAHNRRLSHDFRNFRGNYAESAMRKNATDIAILLNEAKSLGIDETSVRVLSDNDLRAAAREYGTEKLAAIPLDERRSFYKADLVIEVPKTDGTTCYIAVEASYTCNGRDTSRALAHADLITRFTGKEAWPVIAGIRIDRQIQPLVDNGQVFWYQLEDEEMEPDEPC